VRSLRKPVKPFQFSCRFDNFNNHLHAFASIFFMCSACCQISWPVLGHTSCSMWCNTRAFFLGGRRGTRTPKHFVNLTGESKTLKCLNSRQTNSKCIMDVYVICVHWLHLFFFDLNYTMVISLSQTESTTKQFFRKKALCNTMLGYG
jgi:hypothetical protein